MLPHTHLITGIFLSIILIKLNILSINYAIILILVTFLLDIDHVINFIYECKKFSIKEIWDDGFYHHKHTKRTWLHFEKGILLVLIITTILIPINIQLAIAICSGYFLHILLDYYSFNVLEFPAKINENKKRKIHVKLHENAIGIFCLAGIFILLIV